MSSTLTESACRAGENQIYDRYIVTSAVQQYVMVRISRPHRQGLVFPNSIPRSFVNDSTPYIVPAGTYSIRVGSGTNGETGPHTLQTGTPNLARGNIGVVVCWRIQVSVGMVFQEDLRCFNTGSACGGVGATSPYRIHLKPKQSATITVSSTQFDPCLEIGTEVGNVFTRVAFDDNGGGGTSARLIIGAEPIQRDFVINVSARPPVPASNFFTITIQP